MLGELVGEARGKITGMKVLTDGKVELTCQGSGKILGMEMTEIITYEQWVRPGGVFCGEGQILFMTKDGEMAFWKGFGLGRPTGPGFAARYAVCGSFMTASQKLARLLDVAIVTEYEVDENGNYHYKSWEWK